MRFSRGTFTVYKLLTKTVQATCSEPISGHSLTGVNKNIRKKEQKTHSYTNSASLLSLVTCSHFNSSVSREQRVMGAHSAMGPLGSLVIASFLSAFM